jgi:hypothetical protein
MVMETTSAHPAAERSFWVPVICGAVILTIGIGARQSFGIFQKPIALDLNVGRELWSFGNALSMPSARTCWRCSISCARRSSPCS